MGRVCAVIGAAFGVGMTVYARGANVGEYDNRMGGAVVKNSRIQCVGEKSRTAIGGIPRFE
jgi:hypothetical protein